MMENAIAKIQTQEFTKEQIDLLKRTICKGATDDEFALFANQCKRTGLDPFSKQIHAVMRMDRKTGKNVMSIQVGIDGFRLVAQRSGDYEGQTATYWCGKDGKWTDIWLEDSFPVAAKVGVYRKGFRDALYATALWSEYHQGYMKDGKWTVGPMWQQMPVLMLAKCAEALALRKAYPAELSGIYSPEEMSQADKTAPVLIADPREPAKTAPPEPKADDDEEGKRMRKARAEFNQLLSSTHDKASFTAARGVFQKTHGKGIYDRMTCHNETETFMDLVNQHWARIEQEAEGKINAENYRKDFTARLLACDSIKKFEGLEAEFKQAAFAFDATMVDMVEDKAKSLGLVKPEEVE